MTTSPQPTRLCVYPVDELHDASPERCIHDCTKPLDCAPIGDLVGLRISGIFDAATMGITPLTETCLVRTDKGIAECTLQALDDATRQGAARFLRAQDDHWGWLEAVDAYEPLRAEARPGNTGIDVLFLRDAIGVVTRPHAAPLPLGDLTGLPGMVAGLFVQDPKSARRGKGTARTVTALAQVLSGITGLDVDRILLAEACGRISGRL